MRPRRDTYRASGEVGDKGGYCSHVWNKPHDLRKFQGSLQPAQDGFIYQFHMQLGRPLYLSPATTTVKEMYLKNYSSRSFHNIVTMIKYRFYSVILSR